jgi:hypothetical protein
MQGGHREPLKENDGQDHHKGCEIDPTEKQGQTAPKSPKNRFRRIVEKADDGVIGIGIHPGKESTGDDNPHIYGEGDIKNPREG